MGNGGGLGWGMGEGLKMWETIEYYQGFCHMARVVVLVVRCF